MLRGALVMVCTENRNQLDKGFAEVAEERLPQYLRYLRNRK